MSKSGGAGLPYEARPLPARGATVGAVANALRSRANFSGSVRVIPTDSQGHALITEVVSQAPTSRECQYKWLECAMGAYRQTIDVFGTSLISHKGWVTSSR